MAGYIVLYFYFAISGLYGHVVLSIHCTGYRYIAFTRVQGRSPTCLQQTTIGNATIHCCQRNILACFCCLYTDNAGARANAYSTRGSRYFLAGRYITICAGQGNIRSGFQYITGRDVPCCCLQRNILVCLYCIHADIACFRADAYIA